MKELLIKAEGSRLEIIPKTLRIACEDSIKIRFELEGDWKFYEGYRVIFRNFIYSQSVMLNEELGAEVPSELLNKEVPVIKGHEKEITAELMGIMFSSSGDCALMLKRSRKERIAIIE